MPGTAESLVTPETMPAPHKNSPTRVMIVDDHELVRDGLRMLIDRQNDFQVCGEAPDEIAAMRLIREQHPEILVLDISLKEGNGLDLAKWVREHEPAVKVVIS